MQNNNDGSPQFKAGLKKFNKDIINCVEELTKIMNNTPGNHKNEENEEIFKETLREKDQIIEEYRKTLENMREKMHLLRYRIKELEVNNGVKSSSDSEKKIKILEKEKESLARHISSLEESLKEQSIFMVSLKEAMSTDPEEGKPNIDEEIALVDQEILELQCSLERAVS